MPRRLNPLWNFLLSNSRLWKPWTLNCLMKPMEIALSSVLSASFTSYDALWAYKKGQVQHCTYFFLTSPVTVLSFNELVVFHGESPSSFVSRFIKKCSVWPLLCSEEQNCQIMTSLFCLLYITEPGFFSTVQQSSTPYALYLSKMSFHDWDVMIHLDLVLKPQIYKYCYYVIAFFLQNCLNSS